MTFSAKDLECRFTKTKLIHVERSRTEAGTISLWQERFLREGLCLPSSIHQSWGQNSATISSELSSG